MAIRRVPSFAFFVDIFLVLMLSYDTPTIWHTHHMAHPPYRTRIRCFAVSGLSHKSVYLFYFSVRVKYAKYITNSCNFLEVQSNNDAVYRMEPCSGTKLGIKILKISISLAYLHVQERYSCVVVITENWLQKKDCSCTCSTSLCHNSVCIGTVIGFRNGLL